MDAAWLFRQVYLGANWLWKHLPKHSDLITDGPLPGFQGHQEQSGSQNHEEGGSRNKEVLESAKEAYQAFREAGDQVQEALKDKVQDASQESKGWASQMAQKAEDLVGSVLPESFKQGFCFRWLEGCCFDRSHVCRDVCSLVVCHRDPERV